MADPVDPAEVPLVEAPTSRIGGGEEAAAGTRSYSRRRQKHGPTFVAQWHGK